MDERTHTRACTHAPKLANKHEPTRTNTHTCMHARTDFPLKTAAGTRSGFEDDLSAYLETLLVHGGSEASTWPGVDGACNLAELVRRYDFGNAYCHLIPSCPGYHLQDKMHRLGQAKLKSVLQREGNVFPPTNEDRIVYQFSSFSKVTQKFFDQLLASMTVGRDVNGRALGTCKRDFVWPTRLEVKNSTEGYRGKLPTAPHPHTHTLTHTHPLANESKAGASMPGDSKNVMANGLHPDLRSIIRPWSGGRDGGGSALVRARRRSMPHIKTFSRVDGQGVRVSWFCLTSSNMSRAAWGDVQKNGKQIHFLHWELGVLFTPQSLLRLPAGQAFSCSSGHTSSTQTDVTGVEIRTTQPDPTPRDQNKLRVVMPIPYQLPAKWYERDEEPWHW